MTANQGDSIHSGVAKPVIASHLSICLAFIPLVSLLPIDLVNITVMELHGPVSRPLVSR
jgi:hypothetical protein